MNHPDGCIPNNRGGFDNHIVIGTSCVNEATVLHETLHKLGLWHEMSRYDRNQYITIRQENIIQGIKKFKNHFWPTHKNLNTIF